MLFAILENMKNSYEDLLSQFKVNIVKFHLLQICKISKKRTK